MAENKKPAIRFKGFTDAWEQRKLSDEFTDFIVPMRDKPKEFGGNIPWTRIEDIEGKYLNGSLSDQYVTEETIKKMNLKIIPKDSLIVSSSATFGVVAIVTQDLITNQTFIGLVPNDKKLLDYWYAFFHSDSARQYMKLQSAGSTIFYIARENFENMPIVIPTNREMLKIGAYFSHLDSLITLHQRKYDKLVKVKKSMLEKMFPKNGSKFPEIRFNGFTDAWEQRKLGDHSEIVAGGTPNTGHPEYWNPKEIPWMSSGEINNKIIYSTDNMISKIGFSNSSAKWVKEKSVLIALAGQGKTRGTVAISEIPLTTNQSIAAIQPDSFLYYKFLFQNLEGRYNELREVSSGDGTRGGLNKQIISDLEVLAPEIQEQIKIGDFLCGIDTLITLHQRELEKLKNIKKSCLEKMFV